MSDFEYYLNVIQLDLFSCLVNFSCEFGLKMSYTFEMAIVVYTHNCGSCRTGN